MMALNNQPKISMVLRVVITSATLVWTRSVATDTLLPSLAVRYRSRSRKYWLSPKAEL